MGPTRVLWLGGLLTGGLGVLACGSDVEGPGGTAGQGAATTSQGGTSQGGTSQGGGSVGGSSQGGAGPCLAATNDYGDCDMALGWAFDGSDCVPMSGCGCEPDCAAFSQGMEGCIAGCAGFCDEAAFLGSGIAADGWGEGDGCDSIYTCVKADVEPLLAAVVTTVDCGPGTGLVACGAGSVQCDLGPAGAVSASLFAELCAATLIEDVDAIYCEVLGP